MLKCRCPMTVGEAMARAYSDDLRWRVVGAVQAGATVRAAAALFSVSASSASKWSRRHRQTGSVSASPMGGARRDAVGEMGEWLLARVAEAPDLTIVELIAELASRSVRASYGAVLRFLQRNGIGFKKKTLQAAEQERSDVVAARERWCAFQAETAPERLVFLDGRARSGRRSQDQHDPDAWPQRQGRAAGRQGSPWSLANHDPDRCPPSRRGERTLQLRWADRQEELHRLGRASARSDPEAG